MNSQENPARAEIPIPTIRELLVGYEAFNTWEQDEQRRDLQRLTLEKGLAQYFELCSMARLLGAGSRTDFLAQEKRHWIELHRKLQKAHRVMTHGQTTPGAG